MMYVDPICKKKPFYTGCGLFIHPDFYSALFVHKYASSRVKNT